VFKNHRDVKERQGPLFARYGDNAAGAVDVDAFWATASRTAPALERLFRDNSHGCGGVMLNSTPRSVRSCVDVDIRRPASATKAIGRRR